MSARQSNRRLSRWIKRGGTVAGLTGLGTVVLTGAALACHAEVQAGVSCAGVVSYTATSWAPGQASGENGDIGIYLSTGSAIDWSHPGSPVATGAFTASDSSFSGHVTVPGWTPGDSVDVGTRADGVWANGDSGHETRDTGLISVTTSCTTTTTPVEPDWSDATCAHGDATDSTFTIPDVTGVRYADSDGNALTTGVHHATAGETVTVIATPTSGYDFGGSDTRTYAHTFGATPDCTTHVTAVPPTADDEHCAATPGDTSSGDLVIPSQDGVEYVLDGHTLSSGKVDEPAGHYTVTARAEAGYTLSGQTGFDLTVASAGDCTRHVTTTAPTVTDQVCDGTPGGTTSGDVVIPALDGVTWSIDGDTVAAGSHDEAPGTHAVTAVADHGYTLEGTTSWTLTIAAAGDCLTSTTPVTPVVVDAACTGPGVHSDATITLTPVAGIGYTVDGAPVAAGTLTESAGEHTVVAAALPGYELPAGTTSSWTETISDAGACLVPVTPVTPVVTASTCQVGVGPTAASYTVPTTTGVAYHLGSAATALTAGTYAAVPGTSVVITAVPLPGYTLPAGTAASTTLTFATPAGCTALPAATVLAGCTTSLVTLGNTGALPVTFTLTPAHGAVSTVTVAPGATATRHVGAGTVAVTAPGLATVTRTVGKACAAPKVLGTKIVKKAVSAVSHTHQAAPVAAVLGEQLPFTGLPTGLLVLLGLSALGLGGLLTVVGARRRPTAGQPT